MTLLQITQTGEMMMDTLNTIEPVQETLSIIELSQKGGWIMIPLAILSVLAVYIFIERFLATTKAAKEDANFMNNIRDFIHSGKIDAAYAMCKSNSSPIARMVEKGISRIGKPLNDINAAIETVGKMEVSKLEKNVAALATVAGGAPMIGFLGTVMGMVKAFFDMAKAGNNVDIQLLSSGIYQAMVTTVGGLIVGIIAYFCYNIIVARISKVVFILEARASEFMDLLNEPAK